MLRVDFSDGDNSECTIRACWYRSGMEFLLQLAMYRSMVIVEAVAELQFMCILMSFLDDRYIS